jgi:transcriptional regulator with XRE-family HTH domain
VQIGENLRQLRIRRGLTQGELADRCELSKGFISQVERDLASPSIATLVDMLECLGSDLKTFFSDDSREKVAFSPADLFEKMDDEERHGKVTWLIPTAQKNSMEPILLELQPGGETAEMPPHEGEEFGYVLCGRVVLRMGEKTYPVKTGGSFCIHPAAPHTLKNPGKTRAKIVWVSTPPSF